MAIRIIVVGSNKYWEHELITSNKLIRFPRSLLRRAMILGVTVLVSIALGFIAARRGDTYDTAIYRAYFEASLEVPIRWSYFDDSHIEIGFQLLTRAIADLTNNVQIYFFIITVGGLFCIGRTARLCGVNRVSALVYFGCSLYPLLFLVQMRQGLANCVAFYGLALYCHRRYGIALGMLLLACSIHVSAALVALSLIGYILWRRVRISLLPMLVLLALGIYCGKYWLYSMNWSRLEYYLNNPEFNQPANIFRLSTFKYLFIGLSAAMLSRRSSESQRLLVFICFSAVLMRVIFADNSAFSGRLGASLTFGEIFIVPRLLERCGRGICWLAFPALCAASIYYLLYIEHPEILALY